MVFVVAAHAIVWGWHARKDVAVGASVHLRTACLALGVAGVVAAVLYLPMARQVFDVLGGPRPATASVATPRWAVQEAIRGLQVGYGTVGLFGVLGLLGVGAISYWRRDAAIVSIFLLPGVISAAVIFFVGGSIRPRFFFSFLGFGLLLLVRGSMAVGSALQRPTGLERRQFNPGIALVILIVIISAVSLCYNYRYPKQDYAGALGFIERHRSASEPVVTAGLATYPYERYYQMHWTAVERPEQFEALRARAERVWVVYSFEEYMNVGVVDQIRRYCKPQRIFPGTLGGGEIVVCSLEKQS
jgi:hypothetical protein